MSQMWLPHGLELGSLEEMVGGIVRRAAKAGTGAA